MKNGDNVETYTIEYTTYALDKSSRLLYKLEANLRDIEIIYTHVIHVTCDDSDTSGLDRFQKEE